MVYKIWINREFDSSVESSKLMRFLLEVVLQLSSKLELKSVVEKYQSNRQQELTILMWSLELGCSILSSYEKECEKDPLEKKPTLSTAITFREDQPAIHISDEETFYEMLNNFQKDFTIMTNFFKRFKVEDEMITFTDENMHTSFFDQEMPIIIIKIFRCSILIMSQAQIFIKEQEIASLNSLPEWIISIIGCIKSNEPNICNCSIEGLIYIISSERNAPAYKQFRAMLKANVGSNF